jgi:hypothetical protein
MEKKALDVFGAILMQRVRDWSITDSDNLVSGKSNSVIGKRVNEILALFESKQREALHDLIPVIVDTTIHHLLWMFEQEEWIDIAVHTEDGIVPSLREVSDGLAGESYDWVRRFSKERYEEFKLPQSWDIYDRRKRRSEQ